MSQKEYIGKKIRELREGKKWSANKLGAMLKKPRSGKTILSWENARTEPDGDTLIELCMILGAEISDFYYKPPEYTYSIISLGEDSNSWVEIPFYGSIAAGVPIEMIDVEDTYLVPSKIIREHEGHRLGVMQIKGNSFNAGGIYDSFYVVVDFDDKEPTNSHDPFAVSIDNSTATVKAIEELENGIRLLPNSYDPTIQPMTFTYDECNDRDVSVLGKIIWTFAPFDYGF